MGKEPERAILTPGWTPEMLAELHKIKRGLEMSASIMRDRNRTGGWEGAERVASSFDRYALRVASLHEQATAPVPSENMPSPEKVTLKIIDPWLNGDPCEGCRDCERVCRKLQDRITAEVDRLGSRPVASQTIPSPSVKPSDGGA